MGPKKWLYIYVRDAGRFWCVGGLSSLARPAVLESWKKRGERLAAFVSAGDARFSDGNFCPSNFPSAALDVP
jgi:hypothetical protein